MDDGRVRTIRSLLSAVLLLTCAWPVIAETRRYTAMLRDGSQLFGEKLDKIDQSVATLDGKPLFQKENPLRFLRDRTRVARLQNARIDLTNGDVLPGTVVEWVAQSLDGTPAHFVVEPSFGDFVSSADRRHRVRIRQSCVKRIIAGRGRLQRFHPGLVRLTDGRRVIARAVRFRPSGARVLTADGVLNSTFEELAELHLLNVNVMEAVTGEARWAMMYPSQMLVRLQTTNGAALTFPQSMVTRDFQPERRTRQDSRGHKVTLFGVQPSWSLDALSVPDDSVVSRSYRNYDEVPLSLLPVRMVKHVYALHRWPWRRNESVTGGPLTSGDLQADLGLGTHSFTALTFDLPSGATELTSHVGLDRSVGDGGCVECRIHRGLTDGPPIWKSEFLRGSDAPRVVGPLSLGGAKQLTLVTDFGHEGRPEGTDPYDIRDHVNWIFPTVRIEGDAERRDDLAFWIPPLKSWQIDRARKQQLVIRPVWNQSLERWEMALLLRSDEKLNKQDALEFRQRVRVSLLNAWLPVAARHDGSGKASYEIGVTVDGKPYGSTMNGDLSLEKARAKADSRVWVLHEYADREVDVAVRLQPLGEKREDYAAVLFDEMSLQPLIRGLSSRQPLKPDVALTSLSPISHTIEHESVRLADGRMTDGRPLTIRGYPMAAGFAAPVGTQITYRLDPAWRRFVAVIGLSDGWERRRSLSAATGR